MTRIDNFLSEQYNISRHKAQYIIERWLVNINWKTITKKCYNISNEDIIKILESKEINYVSRRAKKLDDFLLWKNIEISWKICLDVWASTWWFTQILDINNASKIYAVDVWTMQLAEILKNKENIISIENTDIRNFETDIIFDIITVDISFISLEKILNSILKLWNKNTEYILLFKPQFEVWNHNLTKKWLPKNDWIVKKSLDNFAKKLRSLNVKIKTIEKSSLPWETWNIEYFIFFKKQYE